METQSNESNIMSQAGRYICRREMSLQTFYTQKAYMCVCVCVCLCVDVFALNSVLEYECECFSCLNIYLFWSDVCLNLETHIRSINGTQIRLWIHDHPWISVNTEDSKAADWWQTLSGPSISSAKMSLSSAPSLQIMASYECACFLKAVYYPVPPAAEIIWVFFQITAFMWWQWLTWITIRGRLINICSVTLLYNKKCV